MINIVGWIIELVVWIRRKAAEGKIPKSVASISSNRIREIVKPVVKSGCIIKITDEYKSLYGPDALTNFLKITEVDKREYIKELYDCEDFAEALRHEAKILLPHSTLGEAYVWMTGGRYHAINIYIRQDLTPIFIEPQNDTIYEKLPDGWNVDFVKI